MNANCAIHPYQHNALLTNRNSSFHRALLRKRGVPAICALSRQGKRQRT